MGVSLQVLLGNDYHSREFKGRSLLDLPDSYCVIDIETTGLSPVYDSIIEVAACRVADGTLSDSYSSLINPGVEIDEYITELTGITNEMLSTAPAQSDVLPVFHDFLGSSVLVAHNAHFDINFLYDAFEDTIKEPLKNDFVDTMRISRRVLPSLEHHRLQDIVSHYGIAHDNAHRALGDVFATQQCYELMKRDVISSGISLKSAKPAASISTGKTEFDESHPLYGKIVVFTGTLEKMARKDAMQIVADLGGIPADSITKKTNFLVLGNNDYCKTIKNGKSSKQKKAEKLRLEGADLEVLPESVFYDLVLGT